MLGFRFTFNYYYSLLPTATTTTSTVLYFLLVAINICMEVILDTSENICQNITHLLVV